MPRRSTTGMTSIKFPSEGGIVEVKGKNVKEAKSLLRTALNATKPKRRRTKTS